MYRACIVAILGIVSFTLLAQRGSGVDLKSGSPKEKEEPFHKELKDAAKDYLQWGRVDDEMRWAPWLCRAPQPGKAAFSKSKDEDTHGQKLYSLFAKNHKDYAIFGKDKAAPVGQVIVKQSWIPEEVTEEKDKPVERGRDVDYAKIIRRPPVATDKPKAFDFGGDHFYPYAKKGLQFFKAAKQADLFIMLKLEPTTPGTDAGWVYGTVSPDGKKVTSAGMVESCMKCHKEATSDRLFGPHYGK
jgi:hypothetical protein